jgi:hypothetical protein
MATVSYAEITSAPVVTRAISRIKTPQDRFQNFFGCQPGGPNIEQVGGHNAAWDIFDKTRTIAKGRAPGAGPATTAPQVLGQVRATIYRAHEKIMILDERVFRHRPVGGQYGEVDVAGQRYITQQEGYLAQRFKNSREFMLAHMCRGGFDLLRDGEDWVPVADGAGTYSIDFQIPAGNKGECEMVDLAGTALISFVEPDAATVTALWDQTYAKLKWSDTTNAPIIGQVLALNEAFEAQHGRPVVHAWMSATTYQYMLNNTGLKNAAGTANTVFSDWRDSPMVNAEGIRDTGFEVVFRGLPFLRVHVYSAGLDVNGTFARLIADNVVIFTSEPEIDWFSMLEGSEMVRENRMAPSTERYGLAAWTELTTQPSGSELIAVDNCLPALYVPRCIVYATVNW